MSPREPDSSIETDPGVRWYALLGMGALTIMAAALLWRRGDPWALLPSLLGALSLAFRWRGGPVYVLLAVVLLLLSWWIGTNPGRLFLYSLIWLRWWIVGWDTARIPLRGSGEVWRGALPVADMLLALSLLVYAAGQYRLQGLTRRLFPPDPRRRRAAARQGSAKKKRFDELQRRAPVWVTIGATTYAAYVLEYQSSDAGSAMCKLELIKTYRDWANELRTQHWTHPDLVQSHKLRPRVES